MINDNLIDGIQLTENCFLTLYREDHSELLYRAVTNNFEYLAQWLPWVSEHYSVQDAAEYIKNQISLYQQQTGVQFAIVNQERSEQMQIIGSLGFHQIDKSTGEGCIGYWLDERWQGRGMMTEAVAKLIEIGFTKLCLERVLIKCATQNIKSQSIAKRLNFRFDKTLPRQEKLAKGYVDHAIYVLDK